MLTILNEQNGICSVGGNYRNIELIINIIGV